MGISGKIDGFSGITVGNPIIEAHKRQVWSKAQEKIHHGDTEALRKKKRKGKGD